MQQRPKPESKAMLVMNPPYGERIKVEDMQQLYTMIGERLKHNYAGCSAWILAFKPEHFNHIGLRQSHREKLMNGALECELRGYELFEGRRDSFAERKSRRAEGEQGVGRRIDRRDVSAGREKRSNSMDRENKPPYRSPRPDKPFRTSDNRKKEHNDEQQRETRWPNDRFRSSDESERGPRKSSSKRIQVIRNDE